jgi:hypothetical protein
MADIINDTMNWLSSGNNVIYIAVAVMAVFMIYLLATRKSKPKEFKPLDLKKETKRRYNNEYSYFGIPLKLHIYDINSDKPFGFVIGYMRVVWMEQFKKYEPVHQNFPKEVFTDKIYSLATEVYQKPYEELDDIQRKSIRELAKEELRKGMTEIVQGERPKIVRGKKEILGSNPIPCYMFKITHDSWLYRLLSSISNIGTNYFIFDADQVEFEPKKIILTANFERKTANDIFIFSKAGKLIVQDIGYGIERENVWQETANQIPRAVHFDTEASKALLMKREDAKIRDEQFKHSKEANE